MNNDNEKELRKYEVGFLFLEEKNAIVKQLLEKHHFSIVKEGEPFKFNLAYPIKKVQSVFFNFIQFLAEPLKIEEFFKDLKKEDSILRFILLNLPLKEEAPKKGMGLKTFNRPSLSKKEGKKSFEPILTNEALEKKIEEILK